MMMALQSRNLLQQRRFTYHKDRPAIPAVEVVASAKKQVVLGNAFITASCASSIDIECGLGRQKNQLNIWDWEQRRAAEEDSQFSERTRQSQRPAPFRHEVACRRSASPRRRRGRGRSKWLHRRLRQARDAGGGLAAALGPAGLALHWSNGTSPCVDGAGVSCDTNGRVVAVSAPRAGFNGTLPREAHKLPTLQFLDLRDNNINGLVPVAPFPELRRLHIDSNNFSSVPPGFMFFFPALEVLTMNNNSQLQPWMLRGAAPSLANLRVLQASNASITGTLSLFLSNSTGFPKLAQVSLADNTLTGPVPATFVSQTLRYLDLSNNKLTGSIEFLTNFVNIKAVRLDGNSFTGRLPDFSKLLKLRYISVARNQFTGYVPASLAERTGLVAVYLAGGNVFQGPAPDFGPSVQTDVADAASQGSFCRPEPGPCKGSVTQLLSVAAGFKFPAIIVARWKGNDPCSGWLGVRCDTSGAVTGVNLCRLGLNGTLDPAIGNLSSLQALLLSDNNITGIVPASITSLASLHVLDISDNAFSGTMPRLPKGVVLWAQGNPELQVPAASNSPANTLPTAGKLVFVVALLLILLN